MENILIPIGFFVAGYIVSIITWPWLRTKIAGGIDSEIERLQGRLKKLTEKLP